MLGGMVVTITFTVDSTLLKSKPLAVTSERTPDKYQYQVSYRLVSYWTRNIYDFLPIHPFLTVRLLQLIRDPGMESLDPGLGGKCFENNDKVCSFMSSQNGSMFERSNLSDFVHLLKYIVRTYVRTPNGAIRVKSTKYIHTYKYSDAPCLINTTYFGTRIVCTLY